MLPALFLLVVPYFEVSIEPTNRNFDTRITITNETDEPQNVRVNVWTDRGVPVLWYTTPLPPRASKTISMRDLLIFQTADICANPNESVPKPLIEAVRCQLTTGCKLDLNVRDYSCSQRVGDRHPHAIGYVTLDVVDNCTDITAPHLASYKTLPGTAISGRFEQIANGKVFESAALATEGTFRKPKTPRDPLAKRPPRRCPPVSPFDPQW